MRDAMMKARANALRDVTVRGHWRREFDGVLFRHYYRRLRVPWIAWAMFS